MESFYDYTPANKAWGYLCFTLSVCPLFIFLASCTIVMKLGGMYHNLMEMCNRLVMTKITEMTAVQLRHFSAKLGLLRYPQLLHIDLQGCNETQWSVRLPY